jgi:1,2-phenylacetyl-CoA epoxidase catalytic subunit
MRAAPPVFKVQGVYEVRILVDTNEPLRTAWWHTFYDRVDFLGLTLPQSEAAQFAALDLAER